MVRPAKPDGGRVPVGLVACRKVITEKQCGRLRREFARTHKMKLNALKAGGDRKTARKYLQCQASPEQLQKPHDWRTRADPLAEVWIKASAMLAEAPELEAKALFEFLAAQPGSGLKPGHLRIVQRRVRQWRGTAGPEREVMFSQSRVPGGLLEVDWTHPGAAAGDRPEATAGPSALPWGPGLLQLAMGRAVPVGVVSELGGKHPSVLEPLGQGYSVSWGRTTAAWRSMRLTLASAPTIRTVWICAPTTI